MPIVQSHVTRAQQQLCVCRIRLVDEQVTIVLPVPTVALEDGIALSDMPPKRGKGFTTPSQPAGKGHRVDNSGSDDDSAPEVGQAPVRRQN